MRRVKFSTNNVTHHKTFMVSNEDYDLVSQFNWYLEECGRGHIRVARGATKLELSLGYPVKIKLHRYVLGLKRSCGRVVDHKDGNTLNNMRPNLRLVTHKENMNNRKDNKNKAKVFQKWTDKLFINVNRLLKGVTK